MNIPVAAVAATHTACATPKKEDKVSSRTTRQYNSVMMACARNVKWILVYTSVVLEEAAQGVVVLM